LEKTTGAFELARLTHDLRMARVQRTLRWLEEDVPLLAMRVKDLSPNDKAGKAFCREY